MLVALLAPEVILTVAFIEWIAAVIVTAAPSTSALLGIAVRLAFCKWGYEKLGIVCAVLQALVIALAALLSLRTLPYDAYVIAPWTIYIPHI